MTGVVLRFSAGVFPPHEMGIVRENFGTKVTTRVVGAYGISIRQ